MWNSRLVTSNDEISIESQIEAATQRLHILEPILQALEHPHRVLDVLLEAADAEAGRSALCAEFGLDLVQASAMMDTQFRRVTRSERARVRDDFEQTLASLERLRGLA